MTDRWLGVVASGDAVTIVDANVPADGAITILADSTIKLQTGDRAAAYRLLYRRIADYVRENSIKNAVIKASAVSQAGKPSLAHFHSAELRGIAGSSSNRSAC